MEPWTEARLKKLKTLIDQGFDLHTIAQRFRLHPNTVCKIKRKYDLPRNYFHRWTPEQIKAAEMYSGESGKTRAQVAIEVGVDAGRFCSMIAILRKRKRARN